MSFSREDFRMTDVIARKRDSGELDDARIAWFVKGFTAGEIPDYQVSALLMAIYLRGMSANETASLTRAMALSGVTLDLSGIENAIDKHSTGGVGDKASLIVVPILAAAGARVCKMSGRGLGHTGGTLDKLESIPGFRIGLSASEMLAQVRSMGACLCGQTESLAPADKLLYALRDVTATVGSLPLIVASILSKKLAGGAPALLFDVKVGSGALMETLPEAVALADALISGSVASGKRATAVISDMDRPLGRAVGNSLEVIEAIELLNPETGARADSRLRELCLALSAEALALAKGIEIPDARGECEAALDSAAAYEAFEALVIAQSGDVRYIREPERFAKAAVRLPLAAERGGYVARIDARAVGDSVVALGGGRASKSDVIDASVGIVIEAPVGDFVTRGEPILTIHAKDEASALAHIMRLGGAVAVVDDPVAAPPLVHEIRRGV